MKMICYQVNFFDGDIHLSSLNLSEIASVYSRLVSKTLLRKSPPDTTYYNWKSKYGSMEASDVKRLKTGG